MNSKKRLLILGLLILVVSSLLTVLTMQAVEDRNRPATKIRVACVGDSITQGSEYPNDLWMLLGSNYTLGNFGVNGTTVSIDSAKPYIKETAFKSAQKFQPNIVIIMLGSNDAHPDDEQYNGSFVANYIKLVNGFQGLASKPAIWIVKPPPIFNNGTGISTKFFDMSIIPNIEEAANKLHLPVIDVYATLADHPEYFGDGVHPTLKGSEAIAGVIFDALVSSKSQNTAD